MNYNTKIVLLFGPQTPGSGAALAEDVRRKLASSPRLQWILRSVQELQHHWELASNSVSTLLYVPAKESLCRLTAALRHEDQKLDGDSLPNVILTPLVVIWQLVQYIEFLEVLYPDLPLDAPLRHSADISGLCTGLLTSAVVASAENMGQIQEFGGVVIRLAMLIGAFADAKNNCLGGGNDRGNWMSFLVKWTSSEGHRTLESILRTQPDAYVSVLVDEGKVTITALQSIAAGLVDQLTSAGLIVGDFSLRGAFHRPDHKQEVAQLTQFMDSHKAYKLPSAQNLRFALQLKGATGELHRDVTHSILLRQADWRSCWSMIEKENRNPDFLVMCFSRERCIPGRLQRLVGPRMLLTADMQITRDQAPAPLAAFIRAVKSTRADADHDAIAVIGMSCTVPGAEDLDKFWNILSEGRSQHVEVPKERINFEASMREGHRRRKWMGNFIEGYDSFDFKFFGKSAREAASADPQHRLMLQCAYQAVEQSGYLNDKGARSHIGCYIGVGLTDFENNVTHHPANAYTATGNLKAFTAGKISHFFGWTGPGLTIDTACSSSAVAVHQACRAILSGECEGALAGGVNVMTGPEWFENLDGASFLSPTGQCKPFDKSADGYCRGEGVGAVFLKKLSAAKADGDQILGVIAASAVWQNLNCTPITVPGVESLATLFQSVCSRAGVDPAQVSVVEAHGTGTQVGDPAEYSAVRKALGGSNRKSPLSLGSVKGTIGHLESASGIIALIKVLLMMHNRAIPPQASFHELNPALNAGPSDMIEVSRQLHTWEAAYRVALINNYGASGSNASLVVTQATTDLDNDDIRMPTSLTAIRHPIWLSGRDKPSLQRYCMKLLDLIRSSKSLDIDDLAFNIARQSNRGLPVAAMLTCTGLEELVTKLDQCVAGHTIAERPKTDERAVVLCFGGQASKCIGLAREVYDRVELFRRHIDHCNDICQELGAEGIIPGIFETAPAKDSVHLQTMLFATQYACARSWIEAGVQVSAIVGHSFGELTAMCISGRLSVRDTLTLIIRRARIIESSWGEDKGAMAVLEGPQQLIETLLSRVNAQNADIPATGIACHNTSSIFSISGPTMGIDRLIEMVSGGGQWSSIKVKKRLDVTHAFHSSLVDPLMPQLQEVDRDLHFRPATIPLFMTVSHDGDKEAGPGYAAAHLRNPVYFKNAVERVAAKFPSAIWIEAGSDSTITSIAGNALRYPHNTHFQPVSLGGSASVNALADVTIRLWKEGINCCFWPHHRAQTHKHKILLLPPYQFEISKQWLPRLEQQKKTPVSTFSEPEPQGHWALAHCKGSITLFALNMHLEPWRSYIEGHYLVQATAMCPSTLQLSLVVDALASLTTDPELKDSLPRIQSLQSHAPLVMDSSRRVWLEADKSADGQTAWRWKIFSSSIADVTKEVRLLATGTLSFHSNDDALQADTFATFDRLVDRRQCTALLTGSQADAVLQGNALIYSAFANIVDYKHTAYRSLRKIAGSGLESAGEMVADHRRETWVDLGITDAICQVAGIYLNSMAGLPSEEMWLSDAIDQCIWAPGYWPSCSAKWPQRKLEVYARHRETSDKTRLSDIFVFDPSLDKLVAIVLGVRYAKVMKTPFASLLGRMNSGCGRTGTLPPPVRSAETEATAAILSTPPQHSPLRVTTEATRPPAESSPAEPASNVAAKVRSLIADLVGLEEDSIGPKANLVDLGIDSLMGMEVAREIGHLFEITLDPANLMTVTHFDGLVDCVYEALGYHHTTTSSESGSYSGGDSTSRQSPVCSVSSRSSVRMEETSATMQSLDSEKVLRAFAETKRTTDKAIEECLLEGYVRRVLPDSNELCVVLIVDAFAQLGCDIRKAEVGQSLAPIEYLPQHRQMVELLWGLLQQAKLIDIEGETMTRTAVSVPNRTADEIFESLLSRETQHAADHRLTHVVGSKLADCLSGRTEAIHLLFSDPEGKKILSEMYSQSPINAAWTKQIERFIETLFTSGLNGTESNPIRILEVGAGTCGTSSRLIPMLAKLGVPIEYTITDLSSSLVAGARKRFRKDYPFTRFQVLDIDGEPPAELLESQHIILATNCIHATPSLARSSSNMRKLLRDDGFLCMLEMTKTIPWIDLVFGLLEGWWQFNDGRKHALAAPEHWQQELTNSGYGHIDWTDGWHPENEIQRVIIAMASDVVNEGVSMTHNPTTSAEDDHADRQILVDNCIAEYTQGLLERSHSPADRGTKPPNGRCVLITGATGSLGSQLVAYFASQDDVRSVVCLNRSSKMDARMRQMKALQSKDIILRPDEVRKLHVLQVNCAELRLGLSEEVYTDLVTRATDIVHSAWPMSLTRPLHAFRPQFQAMRRLLQAAQDASADSGGKISFQFISSIAVVGFHPFVSGRARVPEDLMTCASVLRSGYGDAKLVCEMMLAETLRKQPHRFRAMSVRIGQIAGSRSVGHWNATEHLAFIIKSSQTLRALPALPGTLSWCPVEDVASSLGQLVLSDHTPHAIYHIENPVRQPWGPMLRLLAKALNIRETNIVPFDQWVEMVRNFPPSLAAERNPAQLLVDFLEEHFVRMSCGDLILDTTHTSQHSEHFRNIGPVVAKELDLYIRRWQATGFLTKC